MGWNLLLNWRTWIVLAFAGAVAWGQIQTMRLHSAQADLQALRGEYAERDAKAQAEATKALQEAVAKVRAAEDKSVQDVAAVSVKYQQEVKNVAAQKDRVIGDLHTGALALRVQLSTAGTGQGNPAAGNQAGSGSVRCDAAQTSGLLGQDDSAFLVSLASEADAVVVQLAAAQAVIVKDREVCK